MNPQTTQDASEFAVTLRDPRSLDPPDLRERQAARRRGIRPASPESRRRRFLVTPSRLSDEDLRYLTEVDHRRHEALIALDAETGEAVGDARYVRLPGDREAAEVATVVADGWHGRGLATALLTELTHLARADGSPATQLLSPPITASSLMPWKGSCRVRGPAVTKLSSRSSCRPRSFPGARGEPCGGRQRANCACSADSRVGSRPGHQDSPAALRLPRFLSKSPRPPGHAASSGCRRA